MAFTAKTKPIPEVRHVLLELAAYKRYSRAGHLYTDEHAYKFTEDQAAILLEEIDPTSGRPVWRRYKPAEAPKPAVPTGHKKMIDAQTDGVSRIDADDPLTPVNRLDIGDESEIKDIIDSANQEDGVVI